MTATKQGKQKMALSPYEKRAKGLLEMWLMWGKEAPNQLTTHTANLLQRMEGEER